MSQPVSEEWFCIKPSPALLSFIRERGSLEVIRPLPSMMGGHDPQEYKNALDAYNAGFRAGYDRATVDAQKAVEGAA